MSQILERFLIYSQRHQRPIKVILMPGGEQTWLNLTVQKIDEQGFHYLSSKNKKHEKYLFFEEVLAASYARGDRGESPDVKDET